MGETDKLPYSLILAKQRYEEEEVILPGGEVVVERKGEHGGSDIKLEK